MDFHWLEFLLRVDKGTLRGSRGRKNIYHTPSDEAFLIGPKTDAIEILFYNPNRPAADLKVN